MCGIAGFMRSSSPEADTTTLQRMGEAMIHRGPDAGGDYLDQWVGLAHRRLSIIDLSDLGTQPMFSANGRYVIVFNGEIYNFQELRKQLRKAGCNFKSNTDTEVILALYEQNGAACLNQLNGMFAFAIWDKKERSLFLARDRIGKKPLYYYHGGSDRVAFASEIKALLQVPGISREVEPTAVVDYLKYLYIPGPKTIFKNIYKLLPGHYMKVRVGCQPNISQYWDLDFRSSADSISEEDAAAQLYDLINTSTICRMMADVPLGAFLSGGIDSSAIVALMAGYSTTPVTTCSIGFQDKKHDETSYAQEVADHFHTNHAEYMIETNLAETVTRLPRYFDEPFADSSAVPTFHVSRLARKVVTVALAGDGGDENFGGYDKYVVDLKEDLARRTLPRFLLQAINGITRGHSNKLMRKATTLTEGALSDPGRAYYRTNSFISDNALEKLLSNPLKKQCKGYDPATPTLAYWDKTHGADHLTRMLYTDLKTYLPGDILVKVDRMSMAHSLEVRAPLLDYRVVEFAAALPSRLKIRGSTTKLLLKQAFAPHLPPRILQRRKHGFTVPLDSWFRNDLVVLAQKQLLDNAALADYFDLPRIQQLWQEHQNHKADHGTLLWSLLSFSLWQQEYLQV